MACSVCHETGFIEEICPECNGHPDEIGGTGCSTCGGDGYIESPCEACDRDIYDDADDLDHINNDECPKCGHKLTFINIGDGEYGFDRLVETNLKCEECGSHFTIASPIDKLSDGIVDEALGGNFYLDDS